MKVSVILSTYNSPEWLKKVLWGYEEQSYRDFEIVIADDGSGTPTFQLIDYFREKSHLVIKHVWHEDRGFQKSEILNKAILAAEGEYLIFSDGDCIPRLDFVEVHASSARRGYFLSGGYFMLPMQTSQIIEREHIKSGEAFSVRWLRQNGLGSTYKAIKLSCNHFFGKLLNAITPTKATWNGHNSSGWKVDLLSVNGFNEQMQYGGQDRELGERLVNKGLNGKQIRYSAICIHLDHKRGYNTEDSIRRNMAIRKATREQRKTWTNTGITKSEEP